ncbi:MAG: GNAT family N-acetyltransferase [Gemmatimonadaceae bacterium]
MGESRAVYMLSAAHAEALRRLATDPEVAELLGVSDLSSANSVDNYISQQQQTRSKGREHMFVLTDREQVLGLCGLHGVAGANAPEMNLWIARPHRGRGNATFAARLMLELAFENLQLDCVRTRAPDRTAACRHLLEKHGFREVRAEVYEITRQQWQNARNAAALAVLHPLLKPILEKELAAGNDVVEMNTGWPDPDSVFVRLREPFRTHATTLPEGISYNEPNDPHWWKADYGSQAPPRHVLTC